MALLSVNLGKAGPTGIDKRAVSGPIEVRAPGPKGTGGSGLIGDHVADLRHHGGDDQAVYAYAREDLDTWAAELGRPMHDGIFGENLTTVGLDVTGALIGERWQIGADVVLEVATPRIPCRTFADRLDERGWVKRFVAKAVPGAYLRVLEPGFVEAGDRITVVHRPDHDVTIALAFRAFTTERELLPRLAVADALPEEGKELVRKRTPITVDS